MSAMPPSLPPSAPTAPSAPSPAHVEAHLAAQRVRAKGGKTGRDECSEAMRSRVIISNAKKRGTAATGATMSWEQANKTLGKCRSMAHHANALDTHTRQASEAEDETSRGYHESRAKEAAEKIKAATRGMQGARHAIRTAGVVSKEDRAARAAELRGKLRERQATPEVRAKIAGQNQRAHERLTAQAAANSERRFGADEAANRHERAQIVRYEKYAAKHFDQTPLSRYRATKKLAESTSPMASYTREYDLPKAKALHDTSLHAKHVLKRSREAEAKRAEEAKAVESQRATTQGPSLLEQAAAHRAARTYRDEVGLSHPMTAEHRKLHAEYLLDLRREAMGKPTVGGWRLNSNQQLSHRLGPVLEEMRAKPSADWVKAHGLEGKKWNWAARGGIAATRYHLSKDFHRPSGSDLAVTFRTGMSPAAHAARHGLPGDFYDDQRKMRLTSGDILELTGHVAVNRKYDPTGEAFKALEAQREAIRNKTYKGPRKDAIDQRIEETFSRAADKARPQGWKSRKGTIEKGQYGGFNLKDEHGQLVYSADAQKVLAHAKAHGFELTRDDTTAPAEPPAARTPSSYPEPIKSETEDLIIDYQYLNKNLGDRGSAKRLAAAKRLRGEHHKSLKDKEKERRDDIKWQIQKAMGPQGKGKKATPGASDAEIRSAQAAALRDYHNTRIGTTAAKAKTADQAQRAEDRFRARFSLFGGVLPGEEKPLAAKRSAVYEHLESGGTVEFQTGSGETMHGKMKSFAGVHQIDFYKPGATKRTATSGIRHPDELEDWARESNAKPITEQAATTPAPTTKPSLRSRLKAASSSPVVAKPQEPTYDLPPDVTAGRERARKEDEKQAALAEIAQRARAGETITPTAPKFRLNKDEKRLLRRAKGKEAPLPVAPPTREYGANVASANQSRIDAIRSQWEAKKSKKRK